VNGIECYMVWSEYIHYCLVCLLTHIIKCSVEFIFCRETYDLPFFLSLILILIQTHPLFSSISTLSLIHWKLRGQNLDDSKLGRAFLYSISYLCYLIHTLSAFESPNVLTSALNGIYNSNSCYCLMKCLTESVGFMNTLMQNWQRMIENDEE
jgi:hypothetical protein